MSTNPVGRLTSKSQTTIPRPVRQKPSLEPGDTMVYEIEDNAVRMRKQAPLDLPYLRSVQATLGQWESPEDAAAYDDL